MGNVSLPRFAQANLGDSGWDKNIWNKMAAENGLDLSAFIVEKGTEAEEGNTEEVAEISLSPDLEAEEARKEELREQARKVRNNVKVMKKIL